MIGLGLSLPAVAARGRPASAAAYTPQAVHFDGATWATIAELSCTDNGHFSFAGWMKPGAGDWDDSKALMFISDPSVYDTYFDYQDTNQMTFACGNGDGSNMLVGFTRNDIGTGFHHFLGCGFIAAGVGSKIVKIYVDDIENDDGPPGTIDQGPGGTIAVNGRPFYIANDTFGTIPTCDGVDWWIAPGVSLLDGNGDIPLATRRKFIDGSGKPVYLGANGELPTGAAPAVFLSASAGDAASFTTNRGTGGAFTLTGTLTLASGP